MAGEGARRGEFANLWPTMFSVTCTGRNFCRCSAEGQADELRQDRAAARPDLMISLRVEARAASALFSR